MKKSIFLLAILFLSLSSRSEVRLPALFTDHMVIQRDKPITIWGWAAPKEKVTVLFGRQEKSTRTTAEGTWTIQLKPEPATSDPLSMEIKGKNTILLENIVVGDVWICSGQSNMEWTFRRLEVGESEASKADYPDLRMFTVTKEWAMIPQSELTGSGWQVARGESIMDFSAVAYYFGKHLLEETGVPIGLLTTSWGGTNVEAWTSMHTLQNYSHIAQIYEGLDKEQDYSRSGQERSMKQRLEMIKETVYEGTGLKKEWQKAETPMDDWEEILLTHDKGKELFAEFDGAIWLRKKFDIPGPFRDKDIHLKLGRLSDHNMVWINGTLVGETFETRNLNIYQVTADLLKPKGNDLVIRVYDYSNKGGFITDPYLMNFHPTGDSKGYQLLGGDWLFKKSERLESPPDLPPDRSEGGVVNSSPSCLFNQMIHPLLKLSITGAIWYQGESNASRAQEYTTLFSDMIKDWRMHWNQGDFPFLFVQLAAYDRPSTQTWPELREAQQRALRLPNTGMAVTTDIGHPTNIHPENKWDVGKRLALPALKMVYGKELTWSGPVLEAAEAQEGKMKLTFSQVGEGLKAIGDYGYLMGFELSEDGEHYEFAQAWIEGKNVVRLHSTKVKNPQYVRYAWDNYPVDANLFNSEGLPASPFRTGSWEWITKGNRYGD